MYIFHLSYEKRLDATSIDHLNLYSEIPNYFSSANLPGNGQMRANKHMPLISSWSIFFLLIKGVFNNDI